jgi:hypothetical protein|tara:strand:- start:6 stop:149 length:144 start_codon:yes stop_codon:yes gene_type:complete
MSDCTCEDCKSKLTKLQLQAKGKEMGIKLDLRLSKDKLIAQLDKAFI